MGNLLKLFLPIHVCRDECAVATATDCTDANAAAIVTSMQEKKFFSQICLQFLLNLKIEL